MSALSFACGHCNSENIQRLPGIVQDGSTFGSSVGLGFSLGDEGNGPVILGSVQQKTTELARALSPPAPPRLSKWASMLFIAIAVLLGIPGLVVGSNADNAKEVGIGVLLMVPSLLLLACALLLFLRVRRRERVAEVSWRSELTIWQSLFYCSRCHHVSDLNRGVAVPAEAMHTLLVI